MFDDGDERKVTDLGSSSRGQATPVAEVAAERAHKKAVTEDETTEKQRARYHRYKAKAHDRYDRRMELSLAQTSEQHWKNKQAGKNESNYSSPNSTGAYTTGRYAQNSTDWEKKLGGYPADMVAAEKKQ